MSGITSSPGRRSRTCGSSTRRPTDLAQFGLAEPRGRGRLPGRRARRTFRHLLLGDKTADAGELYATRGGKQVFLIPSFLESSFNQSTFDLRDKSVLKFDRDKVDRVDSRSAGGTPMALAKDGADWTARRAACRRGPTSARSRALVGRLQTAQMKSIAAQEAADLKKYGLDKPEVAVTRRRGQRARLAADRRRRRDTGDRLRADASRPAGLHRRVRPAGRPEEAGRRPAQKDVFAFRAFNATEHRD